MKRVKKNRSKSITKFLVLFVVTCIVAALIYLGTVCSSETLKDSPEHKHTTSRNIDEELYRLFIEHPMEEVSKKLWAEIVSGKVKLEWNEEMNDFFGSFGVHSQKETLKINLPFTSNALRSEFGQKYLTVAIYHEAIHHRQYHDRGEKEIGGSCEAYWLVEQEAYSKHCLLAKQLGIHDEAPYCNLIDNETFDQKLLTDLIASDPNFSTCGHM